MRISARVDLVFREGSDAELVDIAARATRQHGNVRWRTGENGGREVHVRFPTQDDVDPDWLGEIARLFIYPHQRRA